MNNVTYSALNETAITVHFGNEIHTETNAKVHQLARKLLEDPFNGFIEAVPTYTTLTIYYEPLVMEKFPFNKLCVMLKAYIKELDQQQTNSKTVRIPVCYLDPFALDLEEVAKVNHLSQEEVIELHTAPTYPVYFLGFSPGFPFLGGMNTKISTPRKQSPRKKIEAGSVGIAGNQTGIYPSSTPGGWQIIGRTPIPLLQLHKKQPTLLQAGDRVQFYSITKQEFDRLEGKQWQFES
ncbi:5-oxoprolinase subunit PxpB [Aquibacillus rhizosphaerae]|uniref:5-oxoprolinase subunit PxpB n=1 Tax=Aquibacillus rhizosphaerae TaxID=3051431 RepID=A0ABT7L1W9_9BACI|nr:5-oxoprolinase subunit PxpB [Aquibacillus sp. LR5S19]MDL4839197.1 5-oxoprolinase subunit PxpB [Aquibacillus sp. LR5S19]